MRKLADTFRNKLNSLLEPHGAIGEFSRKTGFSRTAIETWRDGETTPTLKYLDQIAEKLGKDPVDLLGIEKEAPTVESGLLPALLEIASFLPALDDDEVEAIRSMARRYATDPAKHALKAGKNAKKPL